MKIVQICPYAMDRPGGVQRHVRDLTAWLNANGHEARIIAPPLPGRTPGQNGPLTELGRARSIGVHGTGFEISLAAPWSVHRLASTLRTWGADLVHLHTPWTPALAGQMFRALKLPTVTTIHATLPEQDGAGLVDRYIHRSARKFLRASDRVVTPSAAPIPMLRNLLPSVDPMILPPCVDLSDYKPAAKTPKSLLFLGRLEPRKGLDVLLKAWPKIHRIMPKATLTVAGDGALRDAVQHEQSVTFVQAPSDAQCRALMGKTDLFLAPAPYGESYGLVLAEAMSAGAIPIAAANEGYAALLARHPELLVPPGDSDALSSAVINICQKDRTRLRAAVHATAMQSDVSVCGPKYLKLFQQALA